MTTTTPRPPRGHDEPDEPDQKDQADQVKQNQFVVIYPAPSWLLLLLFGATTNKGAPLGRQTIDRLAVNRRHCCSIIGGHCCRAGGARCGCSAGRDRAPFGRPTWQVAGGRQMNSWRDFWPLACAAKLSAARQLRSDQMSVRFPFSCCLFVSGGAAGAGGVGGVGGVGGGSGGSQGALTGATGFVPARTSRSNGNQAAPGEQLGPVGPRRAEWAARRKPQTVKPTTIVVCV